MAVFIPKWLIGVFAALLVVAAGAGAYVAVGGLNSGQVSVPPIPTDPATSSPVLASPTAPLAPTPTATAATTPAPTTTRTATPTVAPSRTPTVLTFPRADNGSASTAGKHSGLLGIVYADAAASYALQSRRLQVAAWVPTFGSRETPSARASVYNTFRAPAGSGPVQAQITGTIRWRGTLAGTGVLGTGSAIRVDVHVKQGDAIIATENVYGRELRDSRLSVGGIEDVDSEAFSFSANLTAGTQYTLHIEARCSAFTGIAAAVVHCMYAPSDLYGEGYVESVSVAVRF